MMNRDPATQMPTEEEPVPLPATVRALGWTSFLTDFSSEAIYPLLPAFLIRELGGSAVSVGLVDGIANAVAAIVRLPSGMVSDRAGRRPLVLAGYGISALARPLMGFVASPRSPSSGPMCAIQPPGCRSAPAQR
jgi:MFS family permease